jgi:hypothetical protein
VAGSPCRVWHRRADALGLRNELALQPGVEATAGTGRQAAAADAAEAGAAKVGD